MRWGLLSTANINRKLLGGAEGTDEATVTAVAWTVNLKLTVAG